MRERVEQQRNRHGARSEACLHVPAGRLVPALLDAHALNTHQHRDQAAIGQNQATFLVRARRVHEDWSALEHWHRWAWLCLVQTQAVHSTPDADQIAQFDFQVCHISPWSPDAVETQPFQSADRVYERKRA